MTAGMSVAALATTPVKGLAMHHPEVVDVTAHGIAGNRAFFLIDDEDGIVSCTEIGALMQWSAEYDVAAGHLSVRGPGAEQTGDVDLGPAVTIDFYGVRHVTGKVALGWSELFSEIAGRPLRLVRADTEAFDIGSMSLIGSESVASLGVSSGAGTFDARRFRMNVEIAGSAPLAEDGWAGQTLSVGDVVLRVGGKVKRCAATTRNPDTGVVDVKTLALIGAYKGREVTEEYGPGFYFGVYAEVIEPGRIRRGDAVVLHADEA